MKSNKKRLLFVLAILTMALVLSCALVACNKTDTPDAPKKEFTITFDTRGGSEIKPITIAEGATITLPRNPTKEGYIFDGWYLSDEFIEKFNATQTISSNITVYAKWKEDGGNQDEKQSYTITFDTQGGSEVKQLVLKEGETLTLPSNPTKEGSVFDGWYLDSSYTQAFDSTKRIDSNMVLYAKWKILDEGQSIISSNYFDISGLVLTMNKKNYIESTEDVFDLRNKFSTSTGSSWRAFTSPNCDQPTEITTRMANVSVGWNDIYVMVENLTTYENQIYRLKIYKYPTIVYRELNDGFLEIQSVSNCADVLFPDDKIDNITSIGKNAFSSCPSLRTLQKLPKLTNIGPSAFANCKRLTNIEIPDSVTSIGDSAFSGCSGLTSITIPNSVTSIGDSAFYGCTGLTSITVPENNSAYSSVDGILYDKNKTKIVHVPEAIKGATIPDSVTSIGEGTFRGCSSLESITIPFVGAKAGVTSSDTYQYPFGYIFGTSSYAGGVATKQYYYGNSTSSTTSTTYYIPSSLKSVTVTGGNILYGAFRNCTGLTSVTIGNSVTSIGDYAFDGCTGLTSVTIGNSVTRIGSSAFSGCTGLTRVTIGKGVTSIGESAFYGCYRLIEVYNKSTLSITAGSSSYGDIAYYAKNVYKNEGESKLTTDENGYVIYTDGDEKILVAYHGTNTELILPSDITKINQYAFYNCKGLTSVTIGNGVTSIGNYAFYNCTGLTSVTIGKGVTSIGEEAFAGCSSLESITIPFVGASITASNGYDQVFGYIFGYTTRKSSSDSVSGATYQYYGNSKYYHYYIPSSIKSVTITRGIIPSDAFYNCTGLTSVTIGGSVTSIGNYAFQNCSSLTSITIGNSVTRIAGSAFRNCTGLTTVNWNATACTSAGSLYEPIFKGCSNLATVNIGDKVKIIPSYAFEGCTGLTSVTIPDSVTSIGERAFRGCSGLTSVTIPDSVTSIGSSAFSGCTGLTSITIPDSVTSIGGRAFSGCTGLTSITIPDSVTSIGNEAFSYCTGLTSVTIGNGVTSIGDYAFSYCKGLTSVTIGGSVTSIGRSAFYNCTGLTTVNWNATECTSDGSSYYPIFEGCSNLATVNIGDNVKIIPSYAFYNYTGLTSITIPDSVTSIGERAFSLCKGLTSVTIGNSVTSIGDYAFSYCTGLTSVTIGNGVTSIGSDAFSDCYRLVEVYNKSTLSITAGSSSYGDIAYYAKNVYKNEGESKLTTDENGYVIYTDGDEKILVAYHGTNTELALPSYITKINQDAFENCTGLTSVTIGGSVTSIGRGAFYNCTGLTSITFKGTKAQWNAISKGDYWNNNVPATEVVCTDGTVSI